MHFQITVTVARWMKHKEGKQQPVWDTEQSLPPGDAEVVPRPRPGAVPTPGAPGELEGKRRPSGQRRGCLQRYQVFRLFVWWDIGWNAYMSEVSNYGLSCSSIFLFPGWSITTETSRKAVKEIGCIQLVINKPMGKSETLQCMPAFSGRDPWPSFLFRASGKSHLSSGFLPRSLHPQDLLFQLLYWPSLESLFLIKSKLLLED